jgi:hypothetical protein
MLCVAGHLGSMRVMLHVALNSLEVRALALPILPHGRYTESAVAVTAMLVTCALEARSRAPLAQV